MPRIVQQLEGDVCTSVLRLAGLCAHHAPPHKRIKTIRERRGGDTESRTTLRRDQSDYPMHPSNAL